MIYKFKSRATADLIMLGPHGNQALRLMGREPSPKGILEVADMPEALRRLQGAIAEAREAARGPHGDDDEASTREPVGLHQRLWPLVQMIGRAQAEGEAIVWGV